MSNHELLRFERETEPTYTLVRVIGEVDLSNSSALRDELYPLTQQQGRELHLDLGGVSFIDSVGVAILVKAWKRLAQDGSALRIRAVSAWVERLFNRLHLEMFLSDLDRDRKA
jgi:anti-anti-sigma factor